MSAPIDRPSARQQIAERLLTALDDLVRRHLALVLQDVQPENVGLHAELITAEVAHQLAVARSALHRYPPSR